MRLRRRNRRHMIACIPMPHAFEPLAVYNAERARGIVHTPETDTWMAVLQSSFDEWQRNNVDWICPPVQGGGQ